MLQKIQHSITPVFAQNEFDSLGLVPLAIRYASQRAPHADKIICITSGGEQRHGVIQYSIIPTLHHPNAASLQILAQDKSKSKGVVAQAILPARQTAHHADKIVCATAGG